MPSASARLWLRLAFGFGSARLRLAHAFAFGLGAASAPWGVRAYLYVRIFLDLSFVGGFGLTLHHQQRQKGHGGGWVRRLSLASPSALVLDHSLDTGVRKYNTV